MHCSIFFKGAADLDVRLEEQLVDGILYAFQEQVSDDTQVMLSGEHFFIPIS